MKILSVFLLLVCLAHAEKISLFDGKTLTGFDVRKGEEKWWTTRDGMIVGGSMKEKVIHNTFLSTKKSYENFELEFDIKLEKGSGFQNSGIQVRSIRIPDNHEMKGYQVDAGIGWWGKIYDESRRNRVIAEPVDPAALAKVTKDWGWNHYRILCEGPRIRSWINGVPALDFTERAPGIPQSGIIGFQAHGGGTFEVHLKNITIREFAPTPGARNWITTGTKRTGHLTPAQEKANFQLAPGFTAELVASEEQGVSKPVTVTWDTAGRMWTTTATEYPVDANESRDAAEALFAKGGKDQVLIFDTPGAAGPQTPRVFADGLVIPLGILPYGNGAIIQYGDSIRQYFDSDNDGKANGFTTILTGFGIQDSHLFPHQFERMPGGWISLAQGLFNNSNVQRPSGEPFTGGEMSVSFKHCKLARMRPDGSDFDLLSAGPNNIWGFYQTRDGRAFLQEANDHGIPASEFEPGTHYHSGSNDKLRSYAPKIHPSTDGPQMGGTGLSGLALVEDENSPFQMDYQGEVFIIVNPITNRLQIITATINQKGQYNYQKQEDFMISDDKWFRPIAAHFGPDGCLYVVDWYNKIISHNEVPRSHPDRDKKSGRIWRIRHHSQEHKAPVNLTKLPSKEVIAHLGGPNALTARLAWHELSDRNDPANVAPLTKIIVDENATVSRRCGALWALEGMKKATPKIIHTLAKSKDISLRYQAIRLAGELSISETDFLALIENTTLDHRRLRAATANALRYHKSPTPAMMTLAARLGDAPIAGENWDAYDRSFERYLARWAMETHLSVTKKMIESDAVKNLSSEQFLLAIQSLEEKDAAAQLAKAVPRLGRPLSSGELAILGSQLDQPEVTAALQAILANPAQQVALLKSFENIDPALAADPSLSKLVAKASLDLFPKATPENQQLIIRLAAKFRLKDLEKTIRDWLTEIRRPVDESLNALTALRELGSDDRFLFEQYYRSSHPALKREALIALAGLDDPAIVALLAPNWGSMSGDRRQLVIHGLTSNKSKALALAQAANAGGFEGLSSDALGNIVAVLGASHPEVKALLKNSPGLLQPVIQFTGKENDAVDQKITLKGPFTLETWVKLAPGIGNEDSLLGAGKIKGPDLNFYGSTLRFYGGPSIGDLIVATRPIVPNLWTHCALTRDKTGKFKIYLDGVLDTDKSKPFKNDLIKLEIGQSTAPGGSAFQIREYRIWNRERTSDEIRSDFQTEYTGEIPKSLVHRFSGDSKDLKLRGQATVQLTDDSPQLVTPKAAQAAREKFARFHTLADQKGDPEKGKILFISCLACHKVGDTGGIIGPDLSGAGAMSTEALLHNILTPNAQMESGYYRHDIILKNGEKITGSLVGEIETALSIQPVGTALQVIPRADIAQHKITKSSLMPEGLIDHLSSAQIADLFTYLRTLK